VEELVLGSGADAVQRARRWALAEVAEEPAAPDDDVAVVVTELVTNALLHGKAPVVLRLRPLDDGVRVEVQDAGRDVPVLSRHSSDAMTGRGLALVARLCAAWGAEPAVSGGKVVWAEVRAGGGHTDADPDFPADVDLDALLASFPEESSEPLFRVELGPVPTDLLLSAKSHIDNLIREFTFEASAASAVPGPRRPVSDVHHLPADLAQLVTTVVHGWAATRSQTKRQALAAAERGDREVRLSITLPASAADAGEEYLAAMEEADRYARNARLLTLETPPVHRVLRRWCVETIVAGLRAVGGRRAAAAGDDLRPRARGGADPRRSARGAGRASRGAAAGHHGADRCGDGRGHRPHRRAVRHRRARRPQRARLPARRRRDAARRRLGRRRERRGAAPLRPPPGHRRAARRRGAAQRPAGDGARSRGARQPLPALRGVYVHELSLLVAPLAIGGRHLGVLSLTFGGHARVEEQAQRSFVTTLADVTAQALERAKATSAAAEANERLRFLAEASMVLSSTLEYRLVLEAIAQLVVPRIADWCSIQLLEDDVLETAALAHVDPAKVAWAKELGARYPTDMSAPTGAPNVLRTGVGELYPHIPDELLAASAVDDEHLRILREVGMSSVLVVPLTGRSGTLGTVTLISAEGGRRYDAADLAFAEDLARRAALAVENAHTYLEQSGRLATVTRVAEAAQSAILATPACPPRAGLAGRPLRQRGRGGPGRRRPVRGRPAAGRRPPAHRRRARQGPGRGAHGDDRARGVPRVSGRPRRPRRRGPPARPAAARLPRRRGLRHRPAGRDPRRRHLLGRLLRPPAPVLATRAASAPSTCGRRCRSASAPRRR
jgi:GAF domain-containing protein